MREKKAAQTGPERTEGGTGLMRRVVKGFWKVFDRLLGIGLPRKEEEEEHFRDWGP